MYFNGDLSVSLSTCLFVMGESGNGYICFLILILFRFNSYSSNSLIYIKRSDIICASVIVLIFHLILQDTVLGLQALSEFGLSASANLNLDVDVIADNFSRTIHVAKSDAMVLKLVDVCVFKRLHM